MEQPAGERPTQRRIAGALVAGLIQLVNGRSYDAFLLRTDPEGAVEE